MEIKYSNIEPDNKVFQKYELYGFYDKNSDYIANRISDISIIKYDDIKFVGSFLLYYGKKKRELLNSLKDEFKITKDIERKKMCELNSYELASVLFIKLALSKAKVIILDHLDAYLNAADLKQLLLNIRSVITSIDKPVIFVANRIDNIIQNTNNYVIASEDRIIYNGKNIESIHEKTEIMKFVDAANKKGANLKYYKDPSDLLKAIYRSVQKWNI